MTVFAVVTVFVASWQWLMSLFGQAQKAFLLGQARRFLGRALHRDAPRRIAGGRAVRVRPRLPPVEPPVDGRSNRRDGHQIRRPGDCE